MNICILSGRIGKDPQINTVGDDNLVANMSLAVSHDFKKDDQGNYLTTWFRLSAWGKTAEFAQKHVRRGCKVLIHGEILKPDSYDSEYGTRVNKLEMITWPEDEDKAAKEVPF